MISFNNHQNQWVCFDTKLNISDNKYINTYLILSICQSGFAFLYLFSFTDNFLGTTDARKNNGNPLKIYSAVSKFRFIVLFISKV